jgi:hypothetical protein
MYNFLLIISGFIERKEVTRRIFTMGPFVLAFIFRISIRPVRLVG